MSLLNVTSIQNSAAPQANISLNADGSVTLPVITGATAPALFQPGTLWFDTAGPALQIRNPANTAWLSASGGGGTVTGVTGTLPIVSSGGAAPVLSINAATTALPGSIQLADATASRAGSSATLVNTPAFSVPKDASGMTGAAILPSGTDLQRAAIASPVAGMTRFNTSYTPDSLEVYDGANWKQFAYVDAPNPLPASLTYSASQALVAGVYVCNNLTVNAGVVLTTTSGPVVFQCYGDVIVNGSIISDGAGGYGGPGSGPWGLNSLIFIGLSGFGFGSTGNTYPLSSQPYGSGGFSSTTQFSTGGADFTQSGGNGGGGIIIISKKTIFLGGSSILSANGGNATQLVSPTGTFYAQGSGAGAGGLIQLECSGDMTLAGTLNVSGGNGSSGEAAGGFVGGGARGGGGGGGGVIYVKSSSGALTDTSTKSLVGGLGGATLSITSAAGKGENGAGFGGAGGTGGRNTPAGVGTAAQPGSAGIFIVG